MMAVVCRVTTKGVLVRHDDAVLAETVGVRGAAGDLVEAYAARPMDARPHSGVLVVHHMPGYDRATKEIVRRLATEGHYALCVNLHWRDAPGADPDDAAAAARANGGVPDDRFVADAAGGVAWLRDLPGSTGRVGVIGFCSGGRQAFLAGLELDVQAAVDCYGAFVLHEPPEGFPLRVRQLADRVGELRAPLLGLFGNDDRNPSPAEVDELEKLLRDHGKTYEFHRYDDAGHAFFAVDRPSYRVAAATDGWEKIGAFFARHLADPGAAAAEG
jgi:carboxymethylenebutenolidase